MSEWVSVRKAAEMLGISMRLVHYDLAAGRLSEATGDDLPKSPRVKIDLGSIARLLRDGRPAPGRKKIVRNLSDCG